MDKHENINKLSSLKDSRMPSRSEYAKYSITKIWGQNLESGANISDKLHSVVEISPCANELLCQSCGYTFEFVTSNAPLFTKSCWYITRHGEILNRHYTNYMAFPSKVLPVEASLTCSSFKLFCWTGGFAKESKLASCVYWIYVNNKHETFQK